MSKLLMKQSELPILKEQALKLLPISQNELQRRLKISSQDTSVLMQYMLAQHLISREKQKIGFFIKHNGVHTNKFLPLLNSQKLFSPCTGCKIECVPQTCAHLSSWLIEANI